MERGLLLILSGPSGCGKDTVIEEVIKKNPNVKMSVSLTTRKIREGEIPGVSYDFTDLDSFKKAIENGELLEYNKYGSNYYGTPKKSVEELLNKGIDVVLRIDVNGKANIKKIYPEAVSIFMMTPSLEILEKRLRSRGTDTESDIATRLETAKAEIEKSGDYDYYVINDVLENAVNKVIEIINKGHH